MLLLAQLFGIIRISDETFGMSFNKTFRSDIPDIPKFGVYPLKVLLSEYGGETAGTSSNKDQLAVLLKPQESQTENVAPEPKKKKVKPRYSQAMLKKIQARMAEEARQLFIRQKQEFLRETKKRVQQEWLINEAKAQVFKSEFETREKKLKHSREVLEELERKWDEYRNDLREHKKWLQYMTCLRIPNPVSIAEMHTYIYIWTELDPSNQMPRCIKKTEEVMMLLDSLQDVIVEAEKLNMPKLHEDVEDLRNEIRRLLQDNIDRATFNLFSKIETEMVSINVTTSKYSAKCPFFVMSLWAELITPIPSSKGKEVRHPSKIVFDEVDVIVYVPLSLLDVHKVMRAMLLKYDHWTDRCRTYTIPTIPNHKKSMYQLFYEQYETKKEIVEFREQLAWKIKKKTMALPPEPTLSQEILAWEAEPQRALSEEIFYRECKEEDELGPKVKEMLFKHEVNLRERTILGDLLLLEIFHEPPQPKYLRYKHSVTLRENPPKLHPVNFYVRFPPMEFDEVREEDEDEEEIFSLHNKQTQSKFKFGKIDWMEEIKKLIVIQFKPCSTVLWFDTPEVAHWDTRHNYWSSEDIQEIYYDQEEGTLEFKTGRLGLMGLHVNRYLQFPYQDWIFEGNDEGGVNFFLKTSKIELNFKIREKEVCLESIKDAPSKAMNWVFGVYYPPSKLVEVLKKGGIDVFPATDASFYLNEIQSKHVAVESNIHMVWGIFCSSFRFRRSKFNQKAGRSNLLFQAQEVYKNHQVEYCLIKTAMCSSYVLDITEDSDHYSPEPAPYMEVCVDLYSLLDKYCTINAKRLSNTTSFLLVQTVKEFMDYVRPISFS